MRFLREKLYWIFSSLFTTFVLLTLSNTSRGQDCNEILSGDIFLSLDESGSVSDSDFQTSLAWSINLLSFFITEINNGNVRVGVETFSSNPVPRIQLAMYTYSQLSSSISNINRNSGGTSIGVAINSARSAISTYGRTNVTQIIIILTDGRSSDDVLVPSEAARSSGVITVSVGVGGNTDENTLREIAGSPDRMFRASDFNNLESATLRLRQELFDVICQDLPFVLRHGTFSIEESSRNITSTISDFNFYDYNTTSSTSLSYIADGGSNMYDMGNFINIFANDVATAVTYNVLYRSNDVEFIAKSAYPFYTLLRIDNPGSEARNYSIQVYGNAGADGLGSITTFYGRANHGTFTIEYHVFQIYGAGVPTICEVYFIVYSSQAWRSVTPATFSPNFGSSTDILNNTVTVTGTPSKMLMGYTLLSRSGGARISENDVQNAMLEMLKASSREIDHCFPGNELCHYFADCVDVEGGYICVCKSGYTGNGRFCERDDQSTPLLDVSCQTQSITIRVESDYYDRRNVTLEDLHLNNATCGGYANPDIPGVWFFHIPSIQSCSTILTRNSTYLVYSNTISNAVEDNLYTDTLHTASFSCVFPVNLNVSLLSTNYGVIHNVINATGLSGSAQYVASLNQYTDDTHSTQQTKTVYEPTDTMYIMVNIDTNEGAVDLIIETCWVTPKPDINHKDAFTFIRGGCSIQGNPGNLLITNNGNGNTAHFQSKIFAFVSYNMTYLHCSLQICTPTSGQSCTPVCRTKRSTSLKEVEVRKRREASTEEDNVVSLGPFTVKRDNIAPVTKGEDSISRDKGIPVGVLIAAICGTVVTIACLVFAWTCFYRRQQQRLTKKQPDGFTNPALHNVDS